MTDSPLEIQDHWASFQALKGSVLIGGLGLGVAVKAALERPEVTRVDVIEIERDVIELVAPHYIDPRLTIHHADAFTWEPSHRDHWDVVWMDLWPTVSANNVPDMIRLAARYAQRAQWYGAWGAEWCVESLRLMLGSKLEGLCASQIEAIVGCQQPALRTEFRSGGSN